MIYSTTGRSCTSYSTDTTPPHSNACGRTVRAARTAERPLSVRTRPWKEGPLEESRLERGSCWAGARHLPHQGPPPTRDAVPRFWSGGLPLWSEIGEVELLRAARGGERRIQRRGDAALFPKMKNLSDERASRTDGRMFAGANYACLRRAAGGSVVSTLPSACLANRPPSSPTVPFSRPKDKSRVVEKRGFSDETLETGARISALLLGASVGEDEEALEIRLSPCVRRGVTTSQRLRPKSSQTSYVHPLDAPLEAVPRGTSPCSFHRVPLRHLPLVFRAVVPV